MKWRCNSGRIHRASKEAVETIDIIFFFAIHFIWALTLFVSVYGAGATEGVC